MSSDRTTVLLVEDDQNIVDLVRANLIARAHDVVVSKDGCDAVEMLEAHDPDAVLLDLMLPGVDGFELCRELRERSPVGIIVLSARRAETDKVRALNLGADDYMTKPFGIEELLARINATLRRSRPAPAEAAAPATVRAGDLEIDLAARKVTKAGEPVKLTAQEYKLLSYLMHHKGKVVSRTELIEHIYDQDFDRDSNTIEVFVTRIRKKLGADVITTIRGLGYSLEDVPA